MKQATPSIFDDVIQLSFSYYPCIGYLSVFHDSLLQSTEVSVRQKTSTLKTLSHIQGLFESAGKKNKSILIEGDTGIGKTTLCKEICYQWAESKLFTPDEIVLLLLLQDPKTHEITSERQLVNYFSVLTVAKELFLKYLEDKHGAGVTIILDGYNQLSIEQQSNSFFRDLIEGKRLTESQVIVTSKSSASQCLHDSVHRWIEIFELTKYNKGPFISVCLRKYQSKLKVLRKHLLQYPEIEILTHTPINMIIMISLCINVDYLLPTNGTEMYEKFVLYALRHNTNHLVNEIEDLPQPVLDALKQIEYFSYEALINGSKTFQETNLPDVCRKDLTCYGLMQCT